VYPGQRRAYYGDADAVRGSVYYAVLMSATRWKELATNKCAPTGVMTFHGIIVATVW
jgi:hypothetical protein